MSQDPVAKIPPRPRDPTSGPKTTQGIPLFLGADLKGDLISLGGALLAPVNAHAANGDGLLGVFRFVAKDGFEGETDITFLSTSDESDVALLGERLEFHSD